MVGFTDKVKELEPPAASTPYLNVSDRVQAVVDMYGIADVHSRKKIALDGTPGAPTGPNIAVLGDHQLVTDADLALASPVTHLSPNIPSVLILHGAADTTVDRAQSIDLDRRLQDLHLKQSRASVESKGNEGVAGAVWGKGAHIGDRRNHHQSLRTSRSDVLSILIHQGMFSTHKTEGASGVA